MFHGYNFALVCPVDNLSKASKVILYLKRPVLETWEGAADTMILVPVPMPELPHPSHFSVSGRIGIGRRK